MRELIGDRFGLLQGSASHSVAPRRLSTLVVASEIQYGTQLAELVRLLGHEARFTTSVREAIELLDVRMPQLVFTELALPDGTASQLANAVHARTTFLCGMAALLKKELGLVELGALWRAGFDAVLSSPCDKSSLAAMLDWFQARLPVAPVN
ncbi:MAG TPA: hypothetical protein VFQ61_23235 [Polyangiaceae bacterium]|nr:hypothetical protein [Polyangiaceae bacterium]